MVVRVDPRVHERHPDIEDADAIAAFKNPIRHVYRSLDPLRVVGVGLDGNGRNVEFIGVDAGDDEWLIYHAQTPPTKKILSEVGLGGK